MKYLLLILMFAFSFSGCIIVDDDDDYECVYDSDCYSNEACIGGYCEYIPGAPPGTVTVGCNCSTTNYYPGYVRDNYTCESEHDVIQSCNYLCCDAYACYGYAWGAVCL